MVGAEHFLTDRQRAPVERLGVGMAALFQRALDERYCIRIPPCASKLSRSSLERSQDRPVRAGPARSLGESFHPALCDFGRDAR